MLLQHAVQSTADDYLQDQLDEMAVMVAIARDRRDKVVFFFFAFVFVCLLMDNINRYIQLRKLFEERELNDFSSHWNEFKRQVLHICFT
jgi:hypothetical protein